MVDRQFEELIEENQRLIHKVCYLYAFTKQDRQDLFQEILFQLWKSFPNFKELSKVSTWIYRIALNTAITGLRRDTNQIKMGEIDRAVICLPDEGMDEIEQDKLRLLYKAINQLTELERAIVLLYLEEKPYEEMEMILGIANNTLRVKMSRIKEKLRQLVS